MLHGLQEEDLVGEIELLVGTKQSGDLLPHCFAFHHIRRAQSEETNARTNVYRVLMHVGHRVQISG